MTREHRTWTCRTWLSLTAAMIGVVLVVTAAVMIAHNRAAPTEAGALPDAATSTHTAASTSRSATHVSRNSGFRSASEPATALPRRSSSSSPTRVTRHARTSAPSMPAPSRATPPRVAAVSIAAGQPAVLHLPALNVTAAVDPVNSAHGILQVPDDISRVGWWRHSVPPGSPTGSTVIDGHIDSAAAGAGALFHLAELNPGEPITISTATGAVITYRVQARRVYPKAQGLPADLFAQTGPARLFIISCGGNFNTSNRSYDDNIVIFATAQIN